MNKEYKDSGNISSKVEKIKETSNYQLYNHLEVIFRKESKEGYNQKLRYLNSNS